MSGAPCGPRHSRCFGAGNNSDRSSREAAANRRSAASLPESARSQPPTRRNTRCALVWSAVLPHSPSFLMELPPAPPARWSPPSCTPHHGYQHETTAVPRTTRRRGRCLGLLPRAVGNGIASRVGTGGNFSNGQRTLRPAAALHRQGQTVVLLPTSSLFHPLEPVQAHHPRKAPPFLPSGRPCQPSLNPLPRGLRNVFPGGRSVAAAYGLPQLAALNSGWPAISVPTNLRSTATC